MNLFNLLHFLFFMSIFGVFPFLHGLNEKFFKLDGLVVGGGGLLVKLVTVHDHLVDVPFEFREVLVLIHADLLLNSFEVNGLQNDI